MNRNEALKDRAKRRKYGLTPPEVRLPLLEDDSARAFNYLRRDSDWVTGDVTVHTVADQIPVAPGTRTSDTTENGRRTARFVTDAPIQNFFSVQSARYQVREDEHGEGDHLVKLAVYYDAQHPYNVDRMIAAMKASLDYYDAHFSPFQFHQCRILEFPDYAEFAQSFANTIPYSEGIGFIADYRDPEKIDLVTYVTAHEVGHQWWAHQVIGAQMQGETMLSETMAQYSALMVMEKMYGPDMIRKFLRYELDSYLRGRGQDVVEELPLVRVEDQGYIHYRKGSLVMYRLKSVVGEEVINRAAQKLLARYAFQPAPYPSSRDLVALLRAEAGPEHDALITDLFEKITLYDIRTTHAESHPRADGKLDVTLTVTAQKLYADGQGRETPAPLDEDVPVGVFTAEPGKKEFTAKDVLAFEPRTAS
jgi:ABC-2 type transport system permease protein